MAEKAHRKNAEKPDKGGGGDQGANVKGALSDTVGIIHGQVKLLKLIAEKTEGVLDFEHARLLGMYARALVAISNDERHAASIQQHDLGLVSNEDLDDMEREARKVLGDA